MGGAACPLHDAGNDRSIERGSDLQAARRGSLTTPAKPAGERESDAALTPRPGTRSDLPAVGGRRSWSPLVPRSLAILKIVGSRLFETKRLRSSNCKMDENTAPEI